MELEAVVFDLDNTLVDSRHDYREMSLALREVFERRGFQLEDEGNPRRIWEIVRGGMDGMRGLGLSPSEGRELMGVLNDALTSVELKALETVKPMPNAQETLKALKNRGIKLGVATRSGAAYAERCLERTGLGSVIDATLARDEVEKPKPHPDHLLQVIEMLGATPNRVIYVGDSTTDLNTAREAGVRFLGFWWSDERVNRMREAGCESFIKDLREILDHTEEK